MFNCDDLIKELGEYLEDQTAVSIRKELEAHMARCRSCKVLVDSTLQTIKITTGSGSFELPASLSSKIMARITKKGARG